MPHDPNKQRFLQNEDVREVELPGSDDDREVDHFNMSNFMSCNLMDDVQAAPLQRQMGYTKPGEYRNFMRMGMSSMRFMSMRHIIDSWY